MRVTASVKLTDCIAAHRSEQAMASSKLTENLGRSGAGASSTSSAWATPVSMAAETAAATVLNFMVTMNVGKAWYSYAREKRAAQLERIETRPFQWKSV